MLTVVTGMEKTRNLRKTIRRISGSLDTSAFLLGTSIRWFHWFLDDHGQRNRRASPLLSLYNRLLLQSTKNCITTARNLMQIMVAKVFTSWRYRSTQDRAGNVFEGWECCPVHCCRLLKDLRCFCLRVSSETLFRKNKRSKGEERGATFHTQDNVHISR